MKYCEIHRRADLIHRERVYAALQYVLDKPKKPRRLRPCEARLDQQMPLANQWLYRNW